MVEFRLYYDDNGDVLFYTCDKPEGKFIVIDSQTYAECRHDIKIIDGKIFKKSDGIIIHKLVPSDNGIKCSKHDINIIVDDSIEHTTWNTKTYEFRNN